MLRCWQRDSNNINTAKESGVGSGAGRKRERVCVCRCRECVPYLGTAWFGSVECCSSNPPENEKCMFRNDYDENGWTVQVQIRQRVLGWKSIWYKNPTIRYTQKSGQIITCVCMHTLSHTHADTHIDHRTCRKMSKSDYLINVHSTRWWPAFFFSYATELVLNALDIHHQYKYVFMLYERYKNSSTVRLFVHILCTCMMGPCWSSLRVWMLYVGISEISPGSFLFFSFQSLFNGIEDSSWTHGLLQCSSI